MSVKMGPMTAMIKVNTATTLWLRSYAPVWTDINGMMIQVVQVGITEYHNVGVAV